MNIFDMRICVYLIRKIKKFTIWLRTREEYIAKNVMLSLKKILKNLNDQMYINTDVLKIIFIVL